MRRLSIALGGCSLILLGAYSARAQPQSVAVVAKHQLSECMSKRMSADRTLSYNAAMRACKERLQPPKDTLASNGPIEAGTSAH